MYEALYSRMIRRLLNFKYFAVYPTNRTPRQQHQVTAVQRTIRYDTYTVGTEVFDYEVVMWNVRINTDHI